MFKVLYYFHIREERTIQPLIPRKHPRLPNRLEAVYQIYYSGKLCRRLVKNNNALTTCADRRKCHIDRRLWYTLVRRYELSHPHLLLILVLYRLVTLA
jgi:hypothetical protein